MAFEPFPETQAAIDEQWPAIGAAGDWWTGAERVAIVAEMRAAANCGLCAERKQALSPGAIRRTHEASRGLPSSAVDAVHRIASDPGRLSSSWFQQCQDAGLEAAQIIELGGIAATATIVDSLARGFDRPLEALPEARPGEPARKLPPGLETRGAWAPMIPPENAEGLVKDVYAGIEQAAGFVFHVVQALTSAPSAWMLFLQTFLPNYHTHGVTPEGGLARVQVELLAASTSEYNDCFY